LTALRHAPSVARSWWQRQRERRAGFAGDTLQAERP
jgi:hypothetical protein